MMKPTANEKLQKLRDEIRLKIRSKDQKKKLKEDLEEAKKEPRFRPEILDRIKLLPKNSLAIEANLKEAITTIKIIMDTDEIIMKDPDSFHIVNQGMRLLRDYERLKILLQGLLDKYDRQL